MNEDTYQEEIARRVLDASFVRLTLSGVVRDSSVAWQRIVARPVMLKSGPAIQFSFFDQRQDTTKNYRGAEALEQAREVLAIPFSNITLETQDERLQVQRTKKGKAIVSRARISQEAAANGSSPPASASPPAHNRVKALPLPVGQPDAYLQQIGIMAPDGSVKPSMQRKFTQINEFLRALSDTGALESFGQTPLRILDCGCGSAYLTFATYHYLNHVRGIPAAVLGIDSNQRLIAKCAAHSRELGYDGMAFEQTPIEAWRAPADAPPDIVLSLHACDTATDDALALAVRNQARLILSVPCCHKDLSHKIQAEALRPLLRHGILRQRTADIVTDAFRALILRILGYRTEIIEFVTPEQTSKNLMIRALRSDRPDRTDSFAAEYRALKQFWGVTPYLEGLLAAELAPLLAEEKTA